MSSWVVRIAAQSRVCSSCDDHVRPGRRYFFTAQGERFCCQCPPDDYDGEDICDYD